MKKKHTKKHAKAIDRAHRIVARLFRLYLPSTDPAEAEMSSAALSVCIALGRLDLACRTKLKGMRLELTEC